MTAPARITQADIDRATKAAIDALPAQPFRHLVVTQFGKPFSVAGLGNRMRKWCDEAGLTGRSLHGLRKNAVNALLEAGCTIAEVSAITGQTHQVVEHYAAKVNRRKLGKSAIVKFSAARKASA